MRVMHFRWFCGLVLSWFCLSAANAGLMKWSCKPHVSIEVCKDAAKKIFENVNCDARNFECEKRGTQYFCSALSQGEPVWDSWKVKACRTNCEDADGSVWWHADYNKTPEKVVLPQICPDTPKSMKVEKKAPETSS